MFPVRGLGLSPLALLLSRAITGAAAVLELVVRLFFISTSFVYANVYPELAKYLRLILLELSLNPGHFQWELMLNGELCSGLAGSRAERDKKSLLS